MICPYCKIPNCSNNRRVVCFNCRYYHEATTAINLDQDEQELFKKYHCLPINWRTRTDDNWRTDPLYLKSTTINRSSNPTQNTN